jgi:hypothetical protein
MSNFCRTNIFRDFFLSNFIDVPYKMSCVLFMSQFHF